MGAVTGRQRRRAECRRRMQRGARQGRRRSRRSRRSKCRLRPVVRGADVRGSWSCLSPQAASREPVPLKTSKAQSESPARGSAARACTHNAQYTTHNAQRTTHNAQRTTHAHSLARARKLAHAPPKQDACGLADARHVSWRRHGVGWCAACARRRPAMRSSNSRGQSRRGDGRAPCCTELQQVSTLQHVVLRCDTLRQLRVAASQRTALSSSRWILSMCRREVIPSSASASCATSSRRSHLSSADRRASAAVRQSEGRSDGGARYVHPHVSACAQYAAAYTTVRDASMDGQPSLRS
jgi:hypothetical protein